MHAGPAHPSCRDAPLPSYPLAFYISLGPDPFTRRPAQQHLTERGVLFPGYDSKMITPAQIESYCSLSPAGDDAVWDDHGLAWIARPLPVR